MRADSASLLGLRSRRRPMTHRSTRKRTLVVAGIGLAAVAASPPANAVLLAVGAAMATRALLVGAGAARIVPAAVLIAIVVGAFFAPVKTIERVKARPLSMPKPAMTIAELRDPIGHDLPHLRLGLPCNFSVREPTVGLDRRTVRFARAGAPSFRPISRL